MEANRIRDIRRDDKYTKEGIEYCAPYWELILSHHRMTNNWCRKLMGIMDELDEALTEENANRCGRYYATDYIAQKLGLFY